MDYDKMMAAHSIEVQEENGKLKSKIRELERENYELKAENKKLKEKIDTLELCIKNKDELLEEYRKQIDKLKQYKYVKIW